MAYRRSAPPEPSNRWPWFALGLAALVVIVAVVLFFTNRPRTTNVNLIAAGTATPTRAASVTATPAPTSLAAQLTILPTSTPPPTPTRVPVATLPPGGVTGPGSGTPSPPSQPPVAAAAPTLSPAPAQPTAVSNPTPPPAPAAPTPPPAPPAAPTPTPFSGQVSNPGGLGNTRSDLDTAYGPSAGETPDMLTVYRKSGYEYHVGFSPGQERATVVVQFAQPPTPPLTLETAMPLARKLFPKDTQPRSAQPEGNDQFVVERFSSATLAQALGPDVFQANKGQPGDFLVVYVRDTSQAGRIARIVVGPGDDPNNLLAFK